jgi:hypothetical protein
VRITRVARGGPERMFKVVMQYLDGTEEEDDEVFETEDAARE